MKLHKKYGKILLGWVVLLSLFLTLCGCTQEDAERIFAEAAAPAAKTEPAEPEQYTGLRVDFIDVGQADSALVQCDGKAMLIDGGNVADSSLVVSFLNLRGVTELEYMIATHAHEDHAGGLSGPLNTCKVNHVMCSVDNDDSVFFANLQKYTKAQGLEIEIPMPGDRFKLGSATVTILGPVTDYPDKNDQSIILAVDYGETSFLFTGDMETMAEEDMLDMGVDLEATVLKMGHHGSSTSSSPAFMDAVNPQYAVISCGEGNSYGHPHRETLQLLHDRNIPYFRTDKEGNITALSDGKNVTFTTSPTLSPSEITGKYVGNLNSQVFHSTDCKSLPAEENRIYFLTREMAVERGFTPCGRCKP